MAIVELTKDNFEQEVLAAKVPVVIDFQATWCGPCQMQSPIIDKVAQELGDKVKVCKVNVDEQPSIAMEYRIASIPTLVFMKYGMFQERMIGLQNADTIINFLNTLIDQSVTNLYNKGSCRCNCLFSKLIPQSLFLLLTTK